MARKLKNKRYKAEGIKEKQIEKSTKIMYDRESGFGIDCFLFFVMVLYSKAQGGAVTNDWGMGWCLAKR